mmetsp:Transcript_29519/g.88363  ORF Transcript_29519/g.88363 Transcript_29519/m.88363 type:complete len:399 (+) Transcript_29519:48-1244(+)
MLAGDAAPLPDEAAGAGAVVVKAGVAPLVDGAAAVSVRWDKLTIPKWFRGRDGHVTVAVPDGGWLSFGGAVAQPPPAASIDATADVVYFQPLTSPADDGTFGVKVKTTGAKPRPRVAAAGCTIELDGEPSLFIFGGMSMEVGWLGDAYALNMATLEWRSLHLTGEVPSPRDKLGCAAVGDKVYLFGGFGPAMAGDAAVPGDDGANFTWFGDLFEVDTATMVCRRLVTHGTPPSARAALSMCAAADQVVICGGKDRAGRQSDAFVYDTTDNMWRAVSGEGSPAPTSFAACAPLCDGKVVLFGGRTVDDDHTAATSVLDLDTMRWAAVATDGPLPTARGGHTLCNSAGGVLLVGGGADFHPLAGACLSHPVDLHVLAPAVAKRKSIGDTADATPPKHLRV